MVVQDPGFDPADYATWRKVSFAGAPMPDWVQRDFFEKLPKARHVHRLLPHPPCLPIHLSLWNLLFCVPLPIYVHFFVLVETLPTVCGTSFFFKKCILCT